MLHPLILDNILMYILHMFCLFLCLLATNVRVTGCSHLSFFAFFVPDFQQSFVHMDAFSIDQELQV